MIEHTLMNVLILELKLYCGPDKFYGRSKFGQYDEVNDRAPFNLFSYHPVRKFSELLKMLLWPLTFRQNLQVSLFSSDLCKKYELSWLKHLELPQYIANRQSNYYRILKSFMMKALANVNGWWLRSYECLLLVCHLYKTQDVKSDFI